MTTWKGHLPSNHGQLELANFHGVLRGSVVLRVSVYEKSFTPADGIKTNLGELLTVFDRATAAHGETDAGI